MQTGNRSGAKAAGRGEARWTLGSAPAAGQECLLSAFSLAGQSLSRPWLRVRGPSQVPAGRPRLDLSCREQTPCPM